MKKTPFSNSVWRTAPLAASAAIVFTPAFAIADDPSQPRVDQMEEITVIEQKEAAAIEVEPQQISMHLDTYQSPTNAQNAADYLKDLVIMDFQGESDLVPGEDTLYMRGFSSRRFITALNGSAVRNMGGYGVGMTDYALFPPFLINTIEVLPGPHSALYPGQAIGGVVNYTTRPPRQINTLNPAGTLSTSYGSYNTQQHKVTLNGGVNRFTYDLGYQQYHTDGYLRNTETDIENVVGRLGYILPSEGTITFTTSHADIERETAVINDPEDEGSQYDSTYPTVTADTTSYYAWQQARKETTSTRLLVDLNLPTALGTWAADAYYEFGQFENPNLVWANGEDDSQGTREGWHQVDWRMVGSQISNTFQPLSDHTLIIGTGIEQLYNKEDAYNAATSFRLTSWDSYKKRNESLFAFAQDTWSILPQLSLTAGLRQENNTHQSSNYVPKSGKYYLEGEGLWVERGYSQLIPKSFLTYSLADLAPSLRDTAVSVGISRIWRDPGPFWETQARGIPNIGWLEPEHGMGYDLVFSRRLTGDIQMQVNYSYAQIKDYIASNGSFSESDYDYVINLEEVVRQGIEVQCAGSLTDTLRFRLGWAWQEFTNKGNEPAGETVLDARAKNRVNAGVNWQVRHHTTLLFDYKYQSDQIIEVAEETDPGEYIFHRLALDASHVVDVAVEQVLISQWKEINTCTLKVYVKNLFNEDYQDTQGYPATDRTIGAGLRVSF